MLINLCSPSSDLLPIVNDVSTVSYRAHSATLCRVTVCLHFIWTVWFSSSLCSQSESFGLLSAFGGGFKTSQDNQNARGCQLLRTEANGHHAASFGNGQIICLNFEFPP